MVSIDEQRKEADFLRIIKKSSEERLKSIERMFRDIPEEPYIPPKEIEQTHFGITFRTGLMPAQGLCKGPEGRAFEYATGAAADVWGLFTFNDCRGARAGKIQMPYHELSGSHTFLNLIGGWNDGWRGVAKAAEIEKIDNFPLIIGVAADPDDSEEKRIPNLIKLMEICQDIPQIDMIEMTYCPNKGRYETGPDFFSSRRKLLEGVKTGFLDRRYRGARPTAIPVLEKWPHDMKLEDIPSAMEETLYFKFDGLTIGNSSKDYGAMIGATIPGEERERYEFAAKELDMAVSGKPLARHRREKVRVARNYLKNNPPSREVVLIACGGISSPQDLTEGELHEWYTGHIENYKKHGNRLYERVLRSE